MKKNRTSFVVAALASLGMIALAAPDLFAQGGSHSGGSGAGKVSMRDFAVVPMGNTILAFPTSFQGGVRVAAGDVNGDGQAMLAKLARSQSSRQGTFTLTFQGQTTAARGSSANNLKQIGLGIHHLKELRFGFLKADGAGQMKEWQTFRATDVTLKRGVMNAADGNGKGDSELGTVSISFTRLEFAPAIGANGGVWKTTNYKNPSTGQMLIGLLLPAVQKIRA